VILAALLACGEPDPVGVDPCAEVSQALGVLACMHEVADEEAWETLSIDAAAIDRTRETKYLFPASEAAALPTLVVNTNAFALHRELMAEGWPELFPALTDTEYTTLVTDPELRQYFSGELFSLALTDEAMLGFTIWDDPARIETAPTYDEVRAIYTELAERLPAPLTFVPNSSQQREAAALWNADFPIYGDHGITYEAYTTGEGIGTLRLLSIDELEAASIDADFGYQDILVLDEAPLDVERVISGSITGTRQGELSHLNVRSAARGTPNCYLKDAHTQLAPWEGQRVRLRCGASGWSVEPATEDEAAAWWDAIRPDPVEIPAIDADTTVFADLLEIPTDTDAARAAALARYGAKGANLATLYQRIDAEHQLDGFLIPFAWYERFMEDNTWTVDLGDGPDEHSFSQTVQAWLSDPDFLSDGAVRRARLAALRAAMEDGHPDPILLWVLSAKITAVWGDDTTMVRFRSSSNAEDSLRFSGAGLYESESACVADSLDDDTNGPSRCDPDKDNEETLTEALTEVWASLWSTAAYEERDWYGIDHDAASMAVLVNTRSKDEQANIVAFTGSPTAEDERAVINAQLGELDVVSAQAGIIPEKTLLTIEDGAVIDIERVSASSETTGDEVVLSDAQLDELGTVLGTIEATYPVDETVDDGVLLLDTEWKVLDSGRLVIKQIRPFTR